MITYRSIRFNRFALSGNENALRGNFSPEYVKAQLKMIIK
jgi:hypothetical protein